MSFTIATTIQRLSHLCQMDSYIQCVFESICSTASITIVEPDIRDQWILLNLFGEWSPAFIIHLRQDTQYVPSHRFSPEQIDEMSLVIQTIGVQGYLLLIDTLVDWLEQEPPPRRRPAKTTWKGGNGLELLIQELDQTRVLPDVLKRWARADVLAELHLMKSLMTDYLKR
jgi:hypothetical protein